MFGYGCFNINDELTDDVHRNCFTASMDFAPLALSLLLEKLASDVTDAKVQPFIPLSRTTTAHTA